MHHAMAIQAVNPMLDDTSPNPMAGPPMQGQQQPATGMGAGAHAEPQSQNQEVAGSIQQADQMAEAGARPQPKQEGGTFQ